MTWKPGVSTLLPLPLKSHDWWETENWGVCFDPSGGNLVYTFSLGNLQWFALKLSVGRLWIWHEAPPRWLYEHWMEEQEPHMNGKYNNAQTMIDDKFMWNMTW